MLRISQVLEPSDPSDHEATSGQFDPGESTGQGPLRRLGQTAAMTHPRKRAFYYPTTRPHRKPLGALRNGHELNQL